MAACHVITVNFMAITDKNYTDQSANNTFLKSALLKRRLIAFSRSPASVLLNIVLSDFALSTSV